MGGRKHISITGQVFGRLTILERVENAENGSVMYNCICSCGIKCIKAYTCIINGLTKSCGCYNVELGKVRFLTHGKSKHPLFRIWAGIKQRCYDKNVKAYRWYGLKGITMCDEWLSSFESFYSWGINAGWKTGLSIERLNNKFSYSPWNCKWIPRQKQNRNKTNSRLLTHNGLTMSMLEWSERLQMPYGTISRRINGFKWSVEKSLTQPIRKW